MYPSSKYAPNGKLRYMYEVAPISHIIENAGGYSLITKSIKALDYLTKSIHQCTPIFIGSPTNMNDIVMKFID